VTTFKMLSEAEEESYLPRVLPVGWMRIRAAGPAFDHVNGLRVLVSAGVEEDGRKWLHVSASRPNRCPSWEDMDEVKRVFVGDARTAYQVHPPRQEHYNYGSGRGPRVGTVLHLWAPLEGDPPLPNFLRARGGTL
jgi:hypothetical protein